MIPKCDARSRSRCVMRDCDLKARSGIRDFKARCGIAILKKNRDLKARSWIALWYLDLEFKFRLAIVCVLKARFVIVILRFSLGSRFRVRCRTWIWNHNFEVRSRIAISMRDFAALRVIVISKAEAQSWIAILKHDLGSRS